MVDVAAQGVVLVQQDQLLVVVREDVADVLGGKVLLGHDGILARLKAVQELLYAPVQRGAADADVFVQVHADLSRLHDEGHAHVVQRVFRVFQRQEQRIGLCHAVGHVEGEAAVRQRLAVQAVALQVGHAGSGVFGEGGVSCQGAAPLVGAAAGGYQQRGGSKCHKQ